MCLHNFLKNFFGIIFTPNYLHFPEEETPVSVNQSKRAHFDVAVDKISINPDKIEKYMNTIQSGLEILNKEGVVSDRKICDIKECVLNHCKKAAIMIGVFAKPLSRIAARKAITLGSGSSGTKGSSLFDKPLCPPASHGSS